MCERKQRKPECRRAYDPALVKLLAAAIDHDSNGRPLAATWHNEDHIESRDAMP